MLRILTVDDDPQVLRLMKRVLSQKGHEVISAEGGVFALDRARDTHIDVAVVDYEMPDQDGVSVLSALRQLRPESVRILASGALNVERVTDAVNRGDITRVLAKPYSPEILLNTISEALASRKKQAETYIAATQSELKGEGEALDQCFRDRLLRLVAQPIVDARTREPVAYECLLRSKHPVLRGPLEVLRAVEHHGREGRLSAEVAQLAAGVLQKLPPTMRIFVNLHPNELADPSGLASRLEVLRPNAARVTLEITERSKVEDVEGWERSIAVLKGLGFALAVDDLGGGYNSLAVLAHIKPQFIKVDMSLVRDIDSDRNKQRLFELLCQFSKVTEATVVAEGIETEGEAQTCRRYGADLLQGYLLGRPAEVPEEPAH